MTSPMPTLPRYMAGEPIEGDWFARPLPTNVTVGARSYLDSSYCFLHCRSRRPEAVRIGHDSGVYVGTFFELGEDAELSIGNYCSIVGAIFRCDGRVTIGDYALIAHEVTIADDPFAAPPGTGRSRRSAGGGIRIGENVWIAARAVVVGRVTIGDGAIIGAGAVVDRDVPAGAVAVGNPVRILTRTRTGIGTSHEH